MPSSPSARSSRCAVVLVVLGGLGALSGVARADPPPPAPEVPSVAEVPPELGVPLVRFLADRPAVGLYREDSGDLVCVAPCNRYVDGRDGAEFRFEGPGIRPSGSFLLQNMYGEARFRVTAGNRAKSIVGLVLAISGGGAAFVGGIGVATTFLGSGGSGVTFGAGLAGLIGGLVLAVTGAALRQHNETTVERAGAPLSFTF